MADVSGKFFSAKKVRTGVSPSSPGVEQGEALPPVNPPGTSLNSVGLTMPSAFAVANSPLTSNGTIAVTGAGTVGQYVRGDGSLADFPESSGGGSSVSYYLNGSVSQGTIGGVAYLEMNKVPILGAGTDFTRNSNGYIASFITDAGDPNLLEIPGGNWNFESYFSASSGGGSPTFYVELYKVNSGGTATLIASNSANPELISFGTTIAPYFSSLAVPTTVLALTDRLAVRYYVTPSGRTITLHTEGPHLCQIITTFTTGLTALNGLTAQVQNFAVGTSGTDFNISSATATHTFNLPTASGTNRGALSSTDWTTFNNKENAITAGTTAQYYRGDKTFQTLNTSVVPELTNLYYTEARVNANANVAANTAARHNAVTLGTANGLSLSTQQLSLQLASGSQNGALSSTDWTTFNSKENAITAGTTAQYFRGDKTFQTLNTAAVPELTNLYYTEARVNANANVAANTAARHNAVTLGTANGLSLSTQQLSLGLASSSTNGALSSTDWSTFNSKQNALTNPITGTGTSGQIAFFNGTTTITSESGLLWDSTSNRLTIGLITSSYPLTVSNGDVNTFVAIFTGNNVARGLTIGTYNSAVDDSGVFINAQHSSGQISLATAGNQRVIISNGSIDLRNTIVNASSVYFDTTYQDALTVNSLGRLLLNKTDDNGARLQVSGNASISSLGGTGTRMVVADANGLLSTQAITVGTVTNVTASSPLFSSGGATPNITIQQASGSQNGFLSSTDWTTFNNKQNALTNPVTGTGTSGQVAYFNGTSSITGEANLFWDATNDRLGIGTATPLSFLDISSGTTTDIIRFGASSRWGFRRENNDNRYVAFYRGLSSTPSAVWTVDGDNGNLGLGVTPSAWDAGFTVAQIGTGGSVYSANSNRNIYLATNAFFSSGFKYVASDFAGITGWEDGSYVWLTAPSGTAGNAISFTQAMTLGSNSGLSIGTPSAAPSQGLLVQGSVGIGGSPSFKLDVNSLGYGIQHYGNGSNYLRTYAGSSYQVIESNGTNQFGYFNGNFFVQTSATDRLTIASTGAATFSSGIATNGYNASVSYAALFNGNVGILTPTPNGRLAIRAQISNTPSLLFQNGLGAPSTAISNYESSAQTFSMFGTNLYINTDAGFSRFDTSKQSSGIALDEGTLILATGPTGSTASNRLSITPDGNVRIAAGSSNSRLQVNGSFALPHTTKSANYTLSDSDYTVGFDCASNRTANLPDATTCAGRIYVIYQYNTNVGVRYVTLDGNGSQTINGLTTISLQYNSDYSSVMIQSNGSNWVIISDALYPSPT